MEMVNNKLIEELRIQHGYNQEQLAIKMGYKGISAKLRDTVNNLIRQKRVFYVLDENNKKKLRV